MMKDLSQPKLFVLQRAFGIPTPLVNCGNILNTCQCEICVRELGTDPKYNVSVDLRFLVPPVQFSICNSSITFAKVLQ